MGWFSKIFSPIKKIVKSFTNAITRAVDWVMDIFAPDVPDAPTFGDRDNSQGTTVNRRGGNHTIPLVYPGNWNGLIEAFSGSLNLGGIEVYAKSSGDNNKYLDLTYVLCHATPYVGSVNVGNNPNQNGSWGNPAWFDMTTQFASDGSTSYESKTVKSNGSGDYIQMHIQKHMGGTDVITQPTWHTDTNQYRGLVTVKVRLRYDDSTLAGTNNIQTMTRKPTLKFLVGGYNNAVGYEDLSVIVDWLYDYLTNTAYGAGLSPSSLDTDSFDYVKQFMGRDAIPELWSGIYYLKNHAWLRVNTSVSVVTNIKEFLDLIGCTMIYIGGKFYLKMDPNMVGFYDDMNWYSHDITKHVIAESDIIGGIAFEGKPVDKKPHHYNISVNQIRNSELQYPPQESWGDLYLEVTNRFTDFILTTPPEENEVHLTYNGTPIVHWKWHEEQVMSNLVLTASGKHANIQPFDIIRVTYPVGNLNDDYFVVTSADIQKDMTVKLSAKRYIRDGSIGFDPDVALNTKLYSDLYGASKATISALSGTYPNNTQVDSYISATEALSVISNLAVDTAQSLGDTVNGVWTPGARITFDVDFEGFDSKYNVYFRESYERPLANRLIAVTTSNDILVKSAEFRPGGSGYITVAPVSNTTGGEGTALELAVSFPAQSVKDTYYVDFAYDTYPYGYIVNENGGDTATNGILNEDRTGTSWIQFQDQIAPDVGDWGAGYWTPPVGVDSDHTGLETTSDTSQFLHGLKGTWEFNETTPWSGMVNPGGGWLSVAQEGTWVQSDWFTLSDGEYLAPSGYVEAIATTVDGIESTANYAIGWEIADSGYNVIQTYAPDESSAMSNTVQSGYLVGPVANQAYVRMKIYLASATTDTSYTLGIRSIRMKLGRNYLTTESFYNINTSTLSGATGDRELEVSTVLTHDDATTETIRRFGLVKNVHASAAESETKDIIGSYTGQKTSNKEGIRVVDVSTTTTTDATVNITFTGVPNIYMEKDSNGVYKYYRYADIT